ncbi:hypothetical protein BH09PSE6_BH09PSE6_31740 [soil metagenome]
MKTALNTLVQRALLLAAIAAVAGCTTMSSADAQTSDPYAQLPDDASQPPLIAGRVSIVEGDVRIRQPDDPTQSQGQGQVGWQTALINDVVTNGSTLYTGPDSRSELQVGGHAVRLDESSQLTVVQLDETQSIVRLEGGTLNLRWRDYDRNSQLRVLFADGEVDLVTAGRYRIDLHQDGATVTVFEGRAQVVQAGNTVPVEANRSLTATAGRFAFGAPETTVFDQWALSRDARANASIATRYVSPAMTGYEDLDAYGRWDSTPDYGTVWYPSAVPSGWAPYRYGQWRWVPPWGWTWVDSAPWGFAPFHYGRWVEVGGRWGWSPGGYATRPIYAPALVGYGGGGGGGFAFSIRERPSAWYPLAPWQPYRPWYSRNHGYISNLNRPIDRNPPPRGGMPPNYNEQHGMTRDPIRYGRPADRGPAVIVPSGPGGWGGNGSANNGDRNGGGRGGRPQQGQQPGQVQPAQPAPTQAAQPQPVYRKVPPGTEWQGRGSDTRPSINAAQPQPQQQYQPQQPSPQGRQPNQQQWQAQPQPQPQSRQPQDMRRATPVERAPAAVAQPQAQPQPQPQAQPKADAPARRPPPDRPQRGKDPGRD